MLFSTSDQPQHSYISEAIQERDHRFYNPPIPTTIFWIT